MPRFPIKPAVKLTKQQWEALLDRIMTREGGKLTPKATSEIMQYEPPVTRDVGTLVSERPAGPAGTEEYRKVIERLPIEEARSKYAAAPERYAQQRFGGPSIKHLSAVEPGSPEELASGLAYERLRQVPVVTPSVARTTGTMKNEIAEATGTAATEVPLTTELATNAAKAARAWKMMGGMRTLSGQNWELYRKGSRQSSHIQDARDYFISSFTRWKSDPAKFEKAYPREARLLKWMDSNGMFEEVK